MCLREKLLASNFRTENFQFRRRVVRSWRAKLANTSGAAVRVRKGARQNASPFLHQLNEIFEVVFRVVWARRGFGMILDGDNRQRFVAQAFDATIVEVAVRD